MKLGNAEIDESLVTLAELIVKSSEALLTIYQGSKEEIQKVMEYERQGDSLIERLEQILETVRVAPLFQIDRRRLVHRLDDVLDSQERLALNYSLYYPHIPKSKHSFLLKIGEINLEASKLLQNATQVFFTSFDKAKKFIHDIVVLRDKSRLLFYNERAFAITDVTDWKQYYALDNLVKRHRDVLEQIKEAAAAISYIVLKYVT